MAAPSLQHNRTRSAAARAIASTSADPSTPTLDAAFALPRSPTSPAHARNVLAGALASFRSSSSRLLQTRAAAGASDVEAQRHQRLPTEDEEESAPQFTIAEDEDEERQARPSPKHVSFSSADPRLRSHKTSDSSSEYDHIGAGLRRESSAFYDDDDDDACDNELQYASMAEPGSDYADVLKLEPIPSSSKSRSHHASARGRRSLSRAADDADISRDDVDIDDDGDQQALLNHTQHTSSQNSKSSQPRPRSKHVPQDSQATLFSAADDDAAADGSGSGSPITIPFEHLSRGEKTWMWLVTALVSALCLVALLISEDVIDWPGDGIGKY